MWPRYAGAKFCLYDVQGDSTFGPLQSDVWPFHSAISKATWSLGEVDRPDPLSIEVIQRGRSSDVTTCRPIALPSNRCAAAQGFPSHQISMSHLISLDGEAVMSPGLDHELIEQARSCSLVPQREFRGFVECKAACHFKGVSPTRLLFQQGQHWAMFWMIIVVLLAA